MPPTTRKLAKLTAELASVVTRLANLTAEIESLERENRAERKRQAAYPTTTAEVVPPLQRTSQPGVYKAA